MALPVCLSHRAYRRSIGTASRIVPTVCTYFFTAAASGIRPECPNPSPLNDSDGFVFKSRVASGSHGQTGEPYTTRPAAPFFSTETSMQDLMLDLETLDVKPSAVVLSIGAVMFDRYTREQGPTFYVELTNHLDDQIKQGRTISGDTLEWWMRQSEEARQVFAAKKTSFARCTAMYAVTQFEEFCNANSARYIWAKDPDFDVAILRSLFEDYGFKFPFSYSKARAVRTVLDMPFAPVNLGTLVAHNALADAVAQATDIQEAFQCLQLRTQLSASPAEPVSAKTPVLSSSHATSEAIGTVSQIP